MTNSLQPVNADNKPYQTRPICFLDVVVINDWRLKLYAITAVTRKEDRSFDTTLIEAAERYAARTAFSAPPSGRAHGLGFIVVHQGLSGNWLLLDWWENDIWLYHQLHRSDFDPPFEFSRVTSDLAACTWELAVTAFEREAWLDTMIKKRPADAKQYLSKHLNAQM